MRQGDILLRKIEKLPGGLKEKDKILAYGESTHTHRFREGSATIVYEDSNQKQYAVVEETSELLHEQHKFKEPNRYMKIDPGIYEVIQQRELTIQEGIRRVMD